MFHQFGDGDRHGQVRFPRSGRADAEDDIEATDGVDIRLLRDTFRGDRAAVSRNVDGIKKDVAQVGRTVAAEDANSVVNVAGVDRVAILQESIQLGGNLAG